MVTAEGAETGAAAPEDEEAASAEQGDDDTAAATKLQALARSRVQRTEFVKKVMVESQGGVALPGTVQGQSGHYEFWDEEQNQTMIVHLDVDAEGVWARKGGPWSRKEWLQGPAVGAVERD